MRKGSNGLRMRYGTRALQIVRSLLLDGLPNIRLASRSAYRNNGIKVEISPVSRGYSMAIGSPKYGASQSSRRQVRIPRESSCILRGCLRRQDLCGTRPPTAPEIFRRQGTARTRRVDRKLFKTFLVYLISSSRQIADLLRPRRIDISESYELDLKGMVRVSTSEEELVATGKQLIQELSARMTNDDREILNVCAKN